MKDTSQKSKRNYTKKLVAINIFLAWGVLIVSMFTGQASALVTHVFSFVTVLIGIYAGVGHMDYRQILAVTSKTSNKMLSPESDTIGDHEASLYDTEDG